MNKIIKSKTILSHILLPVCILLALEMILFSGVMAAGGVVDQLKDNAHTILDGKMANRHGFLQNEMVNSWSNLEPLVDHVNTTTEQLQATGAIDKTKLDQGADFANPLISAVSDELVESLRNLHVSGVFMILNNQDLDTGLNNKPGIYIRDLDPKSKASNNNDDLLLERGDSSIAQGLGITTDVSWKPHFNFTEVSSYYSFLYNPYQQAIHNTNNYRDMELGYWSPTFKLYGDNEEAISYSVPLIDNTGYVYGVIGIEITHEYLATILPQEEIQSNDSGSYYLCINNEDNKYINVFHDGNNYIDSDTFTLKEIDGFDYLTRSKDGDEIFVSKYPISLYNSSSPYSNEQWTLMAMVPNSQLLSFSNNLSINIITASCLTILFGIAGSFFIVYRITKPIKELSMQNKDNHYDNPNKIKKTNIYEIDQLVSSIESLNDDVLKTANRFNKILDLASVKIAAFEINILKNEFYVTDNFFSLFQMENNQKVYTLDEFKYKLKPLEQYVTKEDTHTYLFKIPTDNNHVYIELVLSFVEEHHVIGIAEDITQRVLEQNIIEYERDHDALTGLLDRRAFWREMNNLFENHLDELKVAAFLMIDLDNLKYVNDNYGHDSGDTYILKATEAFVKFAPEGTLISRISGDEFNLFFYGYENEDQIRDVINRLKEGIDESYITLSNQKQFFVRVSGGISWYPKDSYSVETLQLYSDYAMYNVKHAGKGEFRDFSLENYQNDFFINKNKEELEMMIQNESFQYHYQPIIRSDNGKVFAYEALMRSSVPTLKNPAEILELAKQANRLVDMETITFFKALEGFKENITGGIIKEDAKIFVNSIPSTIMPEEKTNEFQATYADYLKNIVVEVTEEEKTNEEFHEVKLRYIKKWQSQIALDDYGSGYNSEKMLLSLNPKYIKIDMDIIRGIDRDSAKQKIVANIVDYAHERDLLVIAEGIETIGELKQVVKLKVDLLQGFLFAKPQKTPVKISESIIKLIQSLNTKK